ncbi:DUF4326 domain-containing protein [Mycolicibacterium brumae]|uniref:DUF4326 domain-containing protein n=1 Tax=Mycolicibacterium brumae TaxID=85968 RepID=UPI0035215808
MTGVTVLPQRNESHVIDSKLFSCSLCPRVAIETTLQWRTYEHLGAKEDTNHSSGPWRAANPNAVVVSKPSRFANPFRSGSETEFVRDGVTRRVRVRDRAQAVALFRELMAQELYVPGYPSVEEIREVLNGKDVARWCGPDLECHGDVLIETANRTRGR